MDAMISFKEYCVEKKINSEAFKDSDKSLYNMLFHLFMKVHPQSFTQQKKFLINEIRRKYPLQ